MDRTTEKRILRAAYDWPWFGPERLRGILRSRGLEVSFGAIARVLPRREPENARRATVIRLAVIHEIDPENIVEAAWLQHGVALSAAFVQQVLRDHRLLTARQRARRRQELLA